MCDYSLAGLRTRLAVEGEELVVYRFPTGSIGLTSASEVAAHKKEFRGWQRWFDPREVPCAVLHSARCTPVAAEHPRAFAAAAWGRSCRDRGVHAGER